MTLSKVIPLSDDVHYTAWQVPELQNSGVPSAPTPAAESAALPPQHAADAQAVDEAYRRGYEEGLAQVMGSSQIDAQALADVVQAMSKPLE